MTTVTVQIDKEKDLQIVEAMFNNLGLKYETEDEWGDLSERQIEILKASIEDSEAGRVITHEEAMARISAKIKQLTDNK